MAPTGKFEDLIAWQKARCLARDIHQRASRGEFARDFALKDQIRRAAGSVMSNLAEGFERGRRREFYHFLTIAKGSCAEVRSQLYQALDAGYLGEEEFELLRAAAEELTRVVAGLRRAIAGQRDKSARSKS